MKTIVFKSIFYGRLQEMKEQSLYQKVKKRVKQGRNIKKWKKSERGQRGEVESAYSLYLTSLSHNF